ncbi:MAG TPA: ATP synthase F0 subunit C [Erysipelotrichaceae bacterium]|nr:ATP synthase F0 subunit C [Erysipelotrichaceae bacterium]
MEITNAMAAAICMLGVIPSAIGEGWVCCHAIDGMSRNPEMFSKLRTTMILACALVETTAIYCLLVSLLILFIG